MPLIRETLNDEVNHMGSASPEAMSSQEEWLVLAIGSAAPSKPVT